MAEKLETILARATTNTRMRDFYDIHTLWNFDENLIKTDVLREAYFATTQKRQTEHLIDDAEQILDDIANSEHMALMWSNYRNSNNYVGELEWDDVFKTAQHIVLDEIAITDGFALTMV